MISYTTYSINSQDVYDSVYVDNLIINGRSLIRSNPDSAVMVFDNALQISKEINYEKGKSDAYHNVASLYLNRGEIIDAYNYLDKALQLRKDINDSTGIAGSLNNLGVVFSQTGQHFLAIDYYLQSLVIKRAIGNKHSIASTLNNIGRTYRHLNNSEKAFEYYEQARKIYQETGDSDLEAVLILNMGNIHQNNQELNKAQDYYLLVLDMIKPEDYPKLYSNVLFAKGNLMLKKGQKTKAFEKYNQSLRVKKQFDDFGGKAKIYEKFGDIAMDEANFNKANKYYNMAEKMLSGIGLHRQYQGLFLKKSELAEKQSDYKSSLFYREKYAQVKDSLERIDKEYNLAGTKLAYEQQALTDSMSLMQKEHALGQVKFKKRINRQIALVLIIGLGVILIATYLYHYRKKYISERILSEKTRVVIRYNKELEQKNKILKIQKHEISEQNSKLSEISEALDKNKRELEKLSYVTKYVSNAIVITDHNGIIKWLNHGFESLFNMPVEKLIANQGRDIRNFISYNKIDNAIAECVQLKKSVSFENEFAAKDGNKKWFYTTITPYLNTNDIVDKLIFVNSDILDLKIAKQRLIDLNQNLENEVKQEVLNSRQRDLMIVQQSRHASMGEMVSNIAHQWKQPLNAIAVILQNLEDTLTHNELTDAYMDKTVNKTMGLIGYMSQTIDDFRNFFRKDKAKKDFSLTNVINKAISFLSPSFTSKNIKITKNISEDIICNGFPNEYLQVVINILNNAKDILLERDTESPEITIELIRENGKSVLNICDNAGGINENILPDIFKHYFSTKNVKSGSGLGLYMSKNIIEKNMKGQLLAKNTTEGACFTIVL